ncbi:hypothetical protein DPMN_170688 [Dreissena polymorpha]|uniref:Uncharacterized protein n=1 Tax=Dreissena polymorpha TaxID=45954 RepID=A0A9D4DZ22_DREPO|nr:hypothetical protein DPMN_170688 [Dreissena polymorpha]
MVITTETLEVNLGSRKCPKNSCRQGPAPMRTFQTGKKLNQYLVSMGDKDIKNAPTVGMEPVTSHCNVDTISTTPYNTVNKCDTIRLAIETKAIRPCGEYEFAYWQRHTDEN